MRCKCLRSFALSTTALAVMASVFAAAEDIRQPSTPTSSGAIQIKESVDPGVKQQDAVKDPTAATSAKTKAGVPTPAKRKPTEITPIEITPKGEPASQPAPKPEPAAVQTKVKTADEPLRPIPDSMESGPVSVEAASFKGVTPGA